MASHCLRSPVVSDHGSRYLDWWGPVLIRCLLLVSSRDALELIKDSLWSLLTFLELMVFIRFGEYRAIILTDIFFYPLFSSPSESCIMHKLACFIFLCFCSFGWIAIDISSLLIFPSLTQICYWGPQWAFNLHCLTFLFYGFYLIYYRQDLK